MDGGPSGLAGPVRRGVDHCPGVAEGTPCRPHRRTAGATCGSGPEACGWTPKPTVSWPPWPRTAGQGSPGRGTTSCRCNDPGGPALLRRRVTAFGRRARRAWPRLRHRRAASLGSRTFWFPYELTEREPPLVRGSPLPAPGGRPLESPLFLAPGFPAQGAVRCRRVQAPPFVTPSEHSTPAWALGPPVLPGCRCCLFLGVRGRGVFFGMYGSFRPQARPGSPGIWSGTGEPDCCRSLLINLRSPRSPPCVPGRVFSPGNRWIIKTGSSVGLRDPGGKRTSPGSGTSCP